MDTQIVPVETVNPLGLPGQVTATGWVVPEDITEEQFDKALGVMATVDSAVRWWRGDGLAAMERIHGKTYKEYAERLGVPEAVLHDDVWVAQAVGFSFRNENLSWTHHRHIAPLPPAEQSAWLQSAEEQDLSVHELRRLIRDARRPQPVTEGLPAELVPGQVYTTDVLEGLRALPSESVHLVFTDPPYNLGVDYGTEDPDKQKHEDYMAWCDTWMQECARVLADGGSLYVMHYPEVCAQWMLVMDELGLTLRRWITWVYPCNVGQSDRNWTRAQRTILFATKGDNFTFHTLGDPQPFRNPEDKRIQKLIERGQEGVTPYDWWEYDLVKNVSADKTTWPNQLPVELVERVVNTSSNEGDLVLDPFMGSGTTAVAAAKNNRQWIGFDENPRSAEITGGRIVGVM